MLIQRFAFNRAGGDKDLAAARQRGESGGGGGVGGVCGGGSRNGEDLGAR